MSKFSVGFLSIGNELLDGRTLDTNSHFVALELQNVGTGLELNISCKDDILSIHEALALLTSKCSHIIISGGLGPTSDDLTRDAIAKFFKRELVFYPEALQRMKDKFISRNRTMDPSNERQVFFPTGSELILNEWGTAEGFTLKQEDCRIYCLPGVPKELTPMLTKSILPALRSESPKKPFKVAMRFFGLPEANIGTMIEKLNCPSEIFVAYRVIFPEIEVSITSAEEHTARLWGNNILGAIGAQFLVGNSTNEGLARLVSNQLLEKNLTVSVAESCTGGLLGSTLSSISGSSAYFLGGIICYSNESKSRDLGVAASTLKDHGAVSAECARDLAKGVREKFKSHIGISITGVAGPTGGTVSKPVGTFFVGLASSAVEKSFPFFFPSDREGVRRYALFVALDLLRREIGGLSFWNYSKQEPFNS